LRHRFRPASLPVCKGRHDPLIAQLRLKAAVGTLGEDDIAQLNALLKP
jgi:outer membrane protein